jgi:hypothetical protein
MDVLADSILKGLALTFGGSWIFDDYRSNEKMAARELEAHYLDSEWTWRV